MPLRFGLFVLLLAPALVSAAEPGAAIIPGESRPATTRLAEARKNLAAKKWSEGINLLVGLIETGGNDLVPLGDSGRLVQARLLAHLELARLPAEGLAVYRKRVDAQARRLLDDGLPGRVVDEYFCSTAGPAALEQLGDAAFERGRFGEAESWWRQMAPVEEIDRDDSLAYPDPDKETAARAGAKQLLARLFAGQAGFDADLARYRQAHGKAAGSLAGRKGAYADILEALAKQRRARPAAEAGDWTTLAGSPARNRVLPARPRFLDDLERLVRLGRPTWRFDLAKRGLQEEAPPPLPAGRARLVDAARRLAFHPVVVGDQALVADARYITAYDLRTGKASTWYDLDDQVGGTRPSLDLPGLADLRYTLVVADDCLFARLGCQSVRDVRPEKGGKPAEGGESVLVSLALKPRRGGRQRWLVRAIEPGRKEFSVFEGAPVVAASRVFIAATRFEGDRVVTAVRCYPAHPEDSAPLPLWRSDVCETRELLPAGSGTFAQQRRYRHHLLTLAGPHVVYCSHSGAIVALDARTGRRAWALRYPRRDVREPADEPTLRELAPPVFARGKLYVAPADSDTLFCLDPRTGAVLWRRERLDVVHLVGVGQGRLIFTTWRNPRQGNLRPGGLRAVGADDGSDRMGWIKPDGPDGRVPFGRPLLVGDLVLWPTARPFGVSAVRQRDGQRAGLPHIPAGNLVFANGCLLVADRTTLHAFVPPEKLPDEDNRTGLAPRELLQRVRTAAARGQRDLALQRCEALLNRPDLGRLRPAALRERQEVQLAAAEAAARTSPAEAERWLARAGQGSPTAQLDALVRGAQIWESADEGARALRAWQAVLRQGDAPVEDAAGRPQRAGRIALLQIGKLLEREDALAEAQRQAKALLAGKEERDKTLGRLAREVIAAPAARAALADEARAAARARRWERSAWWWGWLAGTLPPGKARDEARAGLAAAWKELGWPHAARRSSFRLPLLTHLSLALPDGERFLAPPGREGPAANLLWSARRDELVCRDRRSGEARWRAALGFEPAWLDVLGHLVVAAGPGGLAALDVSTGERFWGLGVPPVSLWPGSGMTAARVPRETRPAALGDFHLAGERLFFVQGGRALLALDVLAGAVLWQRRVPGERIHHVLVDGEHLLVQAAGQGLVLDAASGRSVRAWPDRLSAWPRRPVALADGGVLVVPHPDRIDCLDVRAKKPVRWSWLPPGKTTRSGAAPLVVAGGGRTVVVVPENLGPRLARLSPETGKLLWRGPTLLDVERPDAGSWLIDRGGSTLYHAEGRRLWAWSLADGKPAWRRDLPESADWRLAQAGETLLAWPVRGDALAFRLRGPAGSLQWRVGPWPGGQELSVLCLDVRSGELVQRLNLPLERLAARFDRLAGPASLFPGVEAGLLAGGVPGPVVWYDDRGLVLAADRQVRCAEWEATPSPPTPLPRSGGEGSKNPRE